MAEPNKELARELCGDLEALLRRIRANIERIDENGPVIKGINEKLGEAVAITRTVA